MAYPPPPKLHLGHTMPNETDIHGNVSATESLLKITGFHCPLPGIYVNLIFTKHMGIPTTLVIASAVYDFPTHDS